ncbi:MAG: carbon-nitrogen hydrolase family protein [Alphaproteobacteria bacterium]
MSRIVRAACVQITATPDVAANLAMIEPMLAEARKNGAQLIALPENCTALGAHVVGQAPRPADPEAEGAMPFFAAQAKKLDAWILAGSLTVRRDDGKNYNRSCLFGPQGDVAAHYDKIHLFDAVLASGEQYRESEKVAPGGRAVLADTPLAKIGMTICYDLRFGHLYRDLAKAGAEIIAVPAAFTVPTGQAHWHVLLRARAIETGCYILAPGQCGTHEANRKTFGHSLIVDPWGAIIAEAGDNPAIIYADLDLDEVARVRQMLPSLKHDRDYAGVSGG